MICDYRCMVCLARKQGDEASLLKIAEDRTAYIAESMRLIAEYAPGLPAPVVTGRLLHIREKYFGMSDPLADEKKRWNAAMLGREKHIRSRIRASADPLRTALLFARTGNYIDFGAFSKVDDAELDCLLERSESESLDAAKLEQLRTDLMTAERIVYLTDNCGEIVFDKLVIEEIRRINPSARITAVVRGADVMADATEADARDVGLEAVAEIVPNGTVIPGTWLPEISRLSRERILTADVIISKGQANFETMSGCGLNVYYLLLCKCERFMSLFHEERLTGLFVRDAEAASIISNGEQGE